MKNLFVALLVLLGLSAPANAITLDDLWSLSLDDFRSLSLADLTVTDLEFVAPTEIPSGNDGLMSLCYRARGVQLFGFPLTDDVLGYVLASDECTGSEIREFSADQMETAQSLQLIDVSIPSVAHNSFERNVRTYGVLTVVVLFLSIVILKKLKSLLRLNADAPMRKKAANRILSALCHAAKCDGLVSSREARLIRRTMQRLARRDYSQAEIMRLSDRVHINLNSQDYINFGKGLRDREKDTMLLGVLYITMAGDRMLPVEYEFATSLAHGLGIPAEDFRRVLYEAFADREANPE
jgi:hypothetical protein